jgi:hypothetical protein
MRIIACVLHADAFRNTNILLAYLKIIFSNKNLVPGKR